MKIKVLYEDSNILAIDKPSGILVHPDERSKEKTILDLFIKKYPKLEIVHRLDQGTSGVMLLAKNQKAYEFLKAQFQTRTIKKIYHAIVNGSVKNDRGVINKPIGRSPKDFRRHLAGRGARGEMREAITEYKVIKRFEAKTSQNFSSCALSRVRVGTLGDKNSEKFSLLELKPKTGRTHQIRVHMKFLNHSVVCDSLYNPDQPCPKGISRMALHAKSIEFQNLQGKTIKVESPLPKEFRKVVK
ncbi:MAG: RluA family pseudouridine synthase [Candidatus Berkelbacteria bacterium]|nr:RluA family pseudouridine synthase [Candidatus Berkelbacteria bacterium]